MKGSEKLPFVQPPTAAPRPESFCRRNRHILRPVSAIVFILLLVGHLVGRDYHGYLRHSKPVGAAQCAQIDPLWPTKKTDALSQMEEYLYSAKFGNESVARLAGVVQIPSESYDDLGPVGEDKRWDTMYDVAAYLEKTFPLVHSKLALEKVNTHGLLYTWQGSDKSLKPTVLMAHQDVVPVAAATINQWTHPPYSGYFDGHFLWGRGASDCKNTLTGILESVETLIGAGFEPKRTVILSFGFDEEASGLQGAGALSKAIMERYGPDSIGIIVDEGGGTTPAWGTFFVTPGVAEKGYIDVDVIVRMPGGHSSIPPPHNGIGVMSELITLVENNRYEPYLADENPFIGMLQCGAAYGPEFPSKWKKLLPSGCKDKSHKKQKLAKEVAKSGDQFKYLFTTSVAVDIIGGGVKANALPERTTALINHRVNVGEHSTDVQKHLTKLAAQVANKYNLTLHAFNDDEETPSSITLSSKGRHTLEPAPVTPTETDGVTPFTVLAGTTRALYGEKMIMAPALMTGNTDTRYYWDLTKHIFRYSPGFDPEDDGALGNIHTVNERVSIVNHLGVIRWYSMFLRNIDEAELP